MALRFSLAAVGILLFIQPVCAQLEILSSLPTCAISCITQQVAQTQCTLTDIPCLCAHEQLWADVSVCTLDDCKTREALTAQRVAKRACGTPVRDKSMTLPIVNTILTGLAGVFLVLRITARSPRRFELLGWDDGLIAVCFITGVPITVADWFLAHNGIGQDIWEVSFTQIDRMLLWFWIAEPFYLWSTIAMKISMLAFYLRVFVDQTFHKWVQAIALVCGLVLVTFTFLLTFQCTPISYTWTHWDQEKQGKCVNLNVGVLSHAAFNILLDLVVLFLPFTQLARLQFKYSWQSKLQIGVMFGIGIIVTVVSCLRLVVIARFANTLNPTWDYYGAALWSGIEIWVGIICACLPTARVFVTRMLPKWMGLSYAKSSAADQQQTPRKHRKVRSTYALSWKGMPSQTIAFDQINQSARFVELKNVDGTGNMDFEKKGNSRDGSP